MEIFIGGLMNKEAVLEWWKYFSELIAPSTLVTIKIVFITVLIGFVVGFALSIILYLNSPMGLRPNKLIYKLVDFLVNLTRSIPIMILIVAVSPITRKIIGTSVGANAVILPLALAASAFIARTLSNTYKDIDHQLIEAAKSFGASDFQIIMNVVVKESVPAIISVITLACVTNIAGSTIAGAVGGGGLGSIALNYGYQSFNDAILYTAVIILYFMVQIVQIIGDKIYKNKRYLRGGKRNVKEVKKICSNINGGNISNVSDRMWK